MLKVVNPAFGWCHVAAGTFALRLARNSTSTPTNKRTHNKKGYRFGSVPTNDRDTP